MNFSIMKVQNFDEMFSLIPSKKYDILINELFNKIFEII